MRHHGDATLDQIADRFGHSSAAFEFHRPAISLLHHACGVPKGDRRALLIGAEWHIDDHQSALCPADDGFSVHDHEVERYRDRRLVAVHDHAEAVADEQEVAITVCNRSRMGVIGRQRDNRALPLQGGDIGRHQSGGRLL